MKELTLFLDDELSESIEEYADDTGFTFEESIIRDLYYWFHDIIPEADELAELGMTEAEWQRLYVDSNEVVVSLRREPSLTEATRMKAAQETRIAV